METSFLPGRTFAFPTDFNRKLSAWLVGANNRRYATLKVRPVDLWREDKAIMLALPTVAPVIGLRRPNRLGREYYLRVASNDYSVDPGFIGRMITWETTIDRVTIKHASSVVSVHERAWANGVNITEPNHFTTVATL